MIADIYLDLLKRSLLNTIYGEHEPGYDESARLRGLDLPAWASTMVGRARLDNVERCVREVVQYGVPGDLIEAGAWRGGVAILMRGCLAVDGDESRRVWVADSFRGVPPSCRHPEDLTYREPRLAG